MVLMTCLIYPSLSTLHREYAALVSVAYYDLFETILRPRLLNVPKIERRDIERAMVRYSVNEPQATAILGSLQTEGFGLIQGNDWNCLCERPLNHVFLDLLALEKRLRSVV